MSDLVGCALYFDCPSGIAGDMTLGALFDLGVPEEAVRVELAKLPLSGYRLECQRVKRGALWGSQVHVHLDGEPGRSTPSEPHSHSHSHSDAHSHSHPHRHYREIRAMLDRLDGDVKRRARDIFDRIARVEARLHGVSVEEVAFHEVGAIDSIVDIVGAAAALAWLAPSSVTARPVPLGGGSVDTAHGRLPVPAPATLELLLGAEVEAGGDVELTTPTGAAILAATASRYGAMPSMRPVAVGWGAGERELADRPNLLRVVAGRLVDRATLESSSVLVEANLDDMNPELYEPLLEALFAAGAVDAWLQPIVMKKGRPAVTVSALADPARRDAVAEALFRESTTLGVRFRPVDRKVLPRRLVEVETEFGLVPVKVGGPDGEVWNAAPEYEACRRLARERSVPVKRVFAAALAAFYRR